MTTLTSFTKEDIMDPVPALTASPKAIAERLNFVLSKANLLTRFLYEQGIERENQEGWFHDYLDSLAAIGEIIDDAQSLVLDLTPKASKEAA